MVDDNGHPEPIEIELTPAGGAVTRRPDPDASELGVGPDRRVATVAAIAGVVGLAIGVLLGWAAAPTGDNDDATSAPSTSVASTGREPTALETVPPLDGVTATTQPRRSSTTDATETITIGAGAIGMPYQIVATTANGNLIVVNLRTAEVGSTRIGRSVEEIPRQVDWLPDGRVLVSTPFSKLMPTTWAAALEESSELDVAVGADLDTAPARILTADDGSIWVVTQGVDRSTLVAIDDDGEPTGPILQHPGRQLVSDPSGGVLGAASDGWYRIDVDDEPHRVTTGDLVAVGADRLLTRECDDALSCACFVIDRSSGTRVRLPSKGLVDGRLRSPHDWFGLSSNSISGDLAAVVWTTPGGLGPGGTNRLVVIDLGTGEIDVVADQGLGSPTDVQWSPDGEWLFYVGIAGIHAYNPSTRDTATVLADDNVPIASYDVRSE